MVTESSSTGVNCPLPLCMYAVFIICSNLQTNSSCCIRSLPSQSTATIKLEVLPLTEGIITLDSLQIDIKEKGINIFFQLSLVSY